MLAALTSSMPPEKEPDYLRIFMQSRQAMGVSKSTLEFYKYMLVEFVGRVNYLTANKQKVERFLNSIPANKNGLATRHAHYRAIKTLHRWVNSEYGLRNPIEGMPAPILGRPIMPPLDESTVHQLIEAVDNMRDKAIITLFGESELRLSELANIKLDDINWVGHCIKVSGKGLETKPYLPGLYNQWRIPRNILFKAVSKALHAKRLPEGLAASNRSGRICLGALQQYLFCLGQSWCTCRFM